MTSIRSLAVVTLLLLPAAAPAQQPPKPASSAAASAPASGSSQAWVPSPLSEPRHGTQFSLDGKFIKRPGQGAPERPTLIVSCSEGGFHNSGSRRFLSATLQAGLPLKIDYVEPSQLTTGMSYYPKVEVHFGLDDGKAQDEQWSAGGDKTSASFQKNTLIKILESHTLVVSTHGDFGTDISAQFDLPDPGPVAQACGLNLHKK
ncbi:MAG TPA: hypothetical protein VEG64_11160 [Candidatus Sulfotelmatobacter sp.]|nr:hypothetical protein [Candidatus Sulfotelmatobacter sp.]